MQIIIARQFQQFSGKTTADLTKLEWTFEITTSSSTIDFLPHPVQTLA